MCSAMYQIAKKELEAQELMTATKKWEYKLMSLYGKKCCANQIMLANEQDSIPPNNRNKLITEIQGLN